MFVFLPQGISVLKTEILYPVTCQQEHGIQEYGPNFDSHSAPFLPGKLLSFIFHAYLIEHYYALEGTMVCLLKVPVLTVTYCKRWGLAGGG